jgi:hypothetical protein
MGKKENLIPAGGDALVATKNDNKIIQQLAVELRKLHENLVTVTKLFAQLSSEGVRMAKKEFVGITPASVIDRLVAVGKLGYPAHMIFKASLPVSTWKLLEPEAKKLIANKNATVFVKLKNRESPCVKTVETLSGPELAQVFRPKFKGAVPPDKQFLVPPTTKKKKEETLDEVEMVLTVLASGTEYVIVKGERGSTIKCPIKTLKQFLK